MLFDSLARLAADLAAPDEPTVAALDPANLLDLVAAPATQRLAALGAVRAAFAAPAAGPGDAAARVGAAVVRGPVDVDQLRVGDRFSSLALLPAAEGREAAAAGGGGGGGEPAARVEGPRDGGGARRDLDRVLVLGLQLVADLAERRDGAPARPDAARTGHSVTAALHLHQRRQHLRPPTNNTHGQLSLASLRGR